MYRIHTFTESGGHATNEDAFAIETHADDSSCFVCAVADGQGGQVGGRAAAEIACRATVETALSFSPEQLARPASWPTILRVADEAVRDAPDAGFTTLIGLCIAASAVCGASSGDSAAVLCNGPNDHRQLTAEQIKNPPVGSGAAVLVPFAAALVEAWMVLIMTDGVWRYAGWDKVYSAMSQHDGQLAIELLQEAARLPGSGELQDDFTVVAIQNAT